MEGSTAVLGDGRSPGPEIRPAARLSVAERRARGRAIRKTLSRSSHAEWEPDAARRDPVEILEQQSRQRIPELVPIRYARMLTSPFAFFRGAAAIMAADLGGRPHTGLETQLCGDAHLSNFGGYLSPDRRLVFDVNDFDETLPGPFEWDLKRLVASLAVAGRERGLDLGGRRRLCLEAARSYREAMTDFAERPILDVWYARLDLEPLLAQWRSELARKRRTALDRDLAAARARDSVLAFDRLTHLVDGVPRIAADPPLVVPLGDLFPPEAASRVERSLREIARVYRRTLLNDRRQLLGRFRYADAAHKVVGVGSVGTRCWILLLLGRENGDPLFLQVKEAGASVLEPFLGRSEFGNHGQRVVEGQRLTQSASDVLLGWTRMTGVDDLERDYYVRQLWDGKLSARVERMRPDGLATYARLCGWTLAHGHARAGDPVEIAGYLGSADTFDRALAAFAELYADRNELDFAALRDAADRGRIPVERKR